MKIIWIILAVLFVILLAWIAWSYFGTRNIERPKILSTSALSNEIEVREVAPMIQATVVVTWSQNEAINKWFKQLAGYIFWWNTIKEPVAMTAPVTASKSNTTIEMTAPVTASKSNTTIEMTAPVAASKSNTTIKMTAPVALQQEGDTYTISFMMPSKYTLETLPKPNNTNISFIELPAKKYYVWKFSWYANESRANNQLEKFKKALADQNLQTSNEPILNQYNDPWTMPLMRINEWWIEVQ